MGIHKLINTITIHCMHAGFGQNKLKVNNVTGSYCYCGINMSLWTVNLLIMFIALIVHYNHHVELITI